MNLVAVWDLYVSQNWDFAFWKNNVCSREKERFSRRDKQVHHENIKVWVSIDRWWKFPFSQLKHQFSLFSSSFH